MVGKTATAAWVALLLGAALAPPAPAAGLDPGITYDPGSPAGKEYAIPLVEARAEGAGTTNQRRAANIPFGVGIHPPGRGSGHRASEGVAPGGKAGRSGAQREGAAESDRSLKSRAEDTENPGGTAGRTLLIALAVLGPAALLAVLLQARRPISRSGRAA
jgi:hypothetical protein